MDAQAGMLAKLFERSMGLGPEWEVSDVWFEQKEKGPLFFPLSRKTPLSGRLPSFYEVVLAPSSMTMFSNLFDMNSFE